MVIAVADPSARIRTQQSPQASPARCGICGKSRCDEGFVDPQLDFEFYGSLIFCYDCIKEMAKVYQMITQDEYQELASRLDQSIANGLKLSAKISEMEKILDGFSSSWLSRDSNPSSIISVDTESIFAPPNEESKPIESESNSTPTDSKPILTTGKSTIGKSGSFDRTIDL